MDQLFGFLLIMVAIALCCRATNAQQVHRRASYQTSIVHHQNPHRPDQLAESAVQFDMHNTNNNNHNVYNEQQQQQQQSLAFGQQYQAHRTPKSEDQLFNVGYSVRFSGVPSSTQSLGNNANTRVTSFGIGETPSSKRQYANASKKLEPEIITGTKKVNEEVEKPSSSSFGDMSPQQFVSSALFERKRNIYKVTPIAPTVLSPTKYYQKLKSTSAQQQQQHMSNPQAPPKKYQQQLLNAESHPFVQSSAEVLSSSPSSDNFFAAGHADQLFDHQRALERGQNFDYSNAMLNPEPKHDLLQRPSVNSAALLPAAEPIVITGPATFDTATVQQMLRSAQHFPTFQVHGGTSLAKALKKSKKVLSTTPSQQYKVFSKHHHHPHPNHHHSQPQQVVSPRQARLVRDEASLPGLHYATRAIYPYPGAATLQFINYHRRMYGGW